MNLSAAMTELAFQIGARGGGVYIPSGASIFSTKIL